MMVPEPDPMGVSILTTAPLTRSITWLMVGVGEGCGVGGLVEAGTGVSVGVGVAVGAGEGVTVGLGSGVGSSVAVGAVAGAVVGTEATVAVGKAAINLKKSASTVASMSGAAVGVTIGVGEGSAVFKAACTVAGIFSGGGVSAAPHPTAAAKITASTVSRIIPRL